LGGEGFNLQVHGVFTRIRSGASLVASSGGARGFANYSAAVEARVDGWLDLLPLHHSLTTAINGMSL
jgi:hypothetical protein